MRLASSRAVLAAMLARPCSRSMSFGSVVSAMLMCAPVKSSNQVGRHGLDEQLRFVAPAVVASVETRQGGSSMVEGVEACRELKM